MNRMIWPTGLVNRRKIGLRASSFCGSNSSPMEKLDRNFADFLRLLNSHGVEYLVIGGYAVGYHGFVRATGDLDVFVGISDRNAEGLVAVFREFGFATQELKKELFLEKGKIVRAAFIDLANLLKNKAASGRMKDLADIEALTKKGR
jgi:hypothetical protein